MDRPGTASGRQLPPWDQAPYFQPVKESNFPNLGSAVQILTANPSRVGLIFSANGAQSIRVSTRADLSSTTGILITTAAGILALTHHDFGILLQQEWYAVASQAGGTLTVIEVLLSKWPGDE